MTLTVLLLVGAAASAGSWWALARGGATARAGAAAGILALALVAVLAIASPSPGPIGVGPGSDLPGAPWNGALASGSFLRLAISLWAATAILLCGVTLLLRGTAGLRPILPATLAALVGGTVSLAASAPALGVLAAGAAGLASVPVVLATSRGTAGGVAAREVRMAVGGAVAVLAVVSVTPVLARVVLTNPEGPAGAPDSGVAMVLTLALLTLVLVVLARVGAIPFHVRVSALADATSADALPLLIAWLPLPLAVVAVDVAAGMLAPTALPQGSVTTLIVALVLLATLAAAVAGWLHDDLRHAVGYLVIADLGLVALALAALDPDAWGPARTWLLTVAVTKSALGAWVAVAEDRHHTRSVPDLRGWLRRSPLLGVALLVIVLATYGLPGWIVLDTRGSLAGLAPAGPWSVLALLASFLTLPVYVRWLWLGVGAPTSRVEGVPPELAGLRPGPLPVRRLAIRPPSRGRGTALSVEQETSDPGAGSTPAPAASTTAARTGRRDPGRAPVRATCAAAADRAAAAVERHRAALLSGTVLALALLATLVASGALDVARAASEPVPVMANPSAVGD